MKIELEKPYSSKYKHGYLVVNKEPRRNVILYNSHNDRTTVSYARYLMETYLGEHLPKDVVVDHINGDKLDDRLDNYQLLTVKENNIKGILQRGETRQMVEFCCGTCGNIFSKQRNQTYLVIKTKNSDYCSRICGGRHLKPSTIIREYRE